ncbi:MAG TPA: FAD:protein FMN transferase [bacterium]|nr:FAD:protein FMN transferase [bacterium]
MDVRNSGRTLAALAPIAMATAGCGLAKNGVGVAPRRPGTELARYETPAGAGAVHVVIVAEADRDEKVHDALAHAAEAAETWTNLLAEGPGSAVARINDAAGKEPVEVGDDVCAVFRRAAAFSHASKGAFDVTAAAEDPAHIDWKKVDVDPRGHTVFLSDAGMKVTLAGIAPGIAIEAARESLQNDGFDDFEIDGHHARYFGGDAGGAPWRAAIDDPHDPGRVLATVTLRDEALATASETGHILDPKTGAPARGFSSVTVLASDTTTAYGYGVAVFAAGPEAGTEILLARGLQGVLVTSSSGGAASTISVTAGLKGRIDLSTWTGGVRWLEAKR